MHELLEYEASILLDIHQESSLLVLAEGMGHDTIVYTTLKLHSDPHNLLLVSNYRIQEARFLCELLTRDDVLHPPSIITAEVNTKERESMYKRGGVVFVSSRILVVDLLMGRMPASLVSGVLVLRAHELQEACQENFAVQLLRERNSSIFIKAISDNAVSLTSGYNHAERVMVQLGIPKLTLWPRFNVQVMSTFNRTQPTVDEIRVPLTEQMIVCQSCILDLVKACIKELADQNPVLSADEFNLENALLPNFDSLVGMYVDPVWNQLSATSRRLIGDISSLRRLLRLLIEDDAVSFLNTLEGIRQAALSSLGLSTDPSSAAKDAGRRQSRNCPSWFLMDQSDRLLVAARNRVYKDYSKKKFRIELNPKWQSVVGILNEIQSTQANSTGTVLILVGHDRTARLLERYLCRGPKSTSRYLSHCHDAAATTAPVATTSPPPPSKPKLSEKPGLTLTQMCAVQLKDNVEENATDGSSDNDSDSKSTPAEIDSEKLPIGCRKVRVSSHILGRKDVPLEVIIRVPSTMSGEENDASVGPTIMTKDAQLQDFIRIFGHRLCFSLECIKPRHVILYEPRVAWVRELEVYKARQHVRLDAVGTGSIESDLDLNVHFMLYENSVEEQRYLTHLRREKEAFESLIHLSSRIVIPRDALLPPMALDDGTSVRTQPRVLVDVREFRSELPALLHRKGLKVEPLTLTIADYILAPHLCVERKSISDLVGSLNSGRLYHQCTAMSRHYPNPVLLIEFSLPTKVSASALQRGGMGFRGDGVIGFSLYTGRHSITSGGEFNSRHLLSKLTLLTIHFPNLRLIWSVTPYCTAELFTELKQGRMEPSVDRLPQDNEHLEDHNVEAVDMLLKLPGISWKNYRRVMAKVTSLYELSRCSLDSLVDILDSRECATKLYNFLHRPLSSSDIGEESGSGGGDAQSTSNNPPATTTANRGPKLSLAGRVKTRRGRWRGRGGSSGDSKTASSSVGSR